MDGSMSSFGTGIESDLSSHREREGMGDGAQPHSLVLLETSWHYLEREGEFSDLNASQQTG
jgi:hypothetical protein